MHVGIKVPNWGPLSGPEAVSRTAVAADERGFHSVWVSDHVAIPAAAAKDGTGLDARTRFLDPLTTLAFLAGQTRNVQLGTGVFVLPLRHAVVVAKEAGTVDVLSDGRLLFGIGVGWLREEFELLDASYTDRGRRNRQPRSGPCATAGVARGTKGRCRGAAERPWRCGHGRPGRFRRSSEATPPQPWRGRSASATAGTAAVCRPRSSPRPPSTRPGHA